MTGGAGAAGTKGEAARKPGLRDGRWRRGLGVVPGLGDQGGCGRSQGRWKPGGALEVDQEEGALGRGVSSCGGPEMGVR